MDFDEIIAKRRSIRKFKPDDIPKDKIDYLLKVARTAPSRTNVQPWRFIVVRDKKVKEELSVAAYNQKIISDAPVAVVIYGDMACWNTVPERTTELVSQACFGNDVKEAADKVLVGWPQHELAVTTAKNATIAATMFMLAAVNCGLGTCWVKLIDDSKVDKVLNVPPSYIPVGIFPLGYPDESPKPRPRLPLRSQVFSNRFGRDYDV